VISAAWRAALIGGLIAAAATLPGLGVGTLWDNSETAYGEVAREILIYGDPIVMHLNGQAWFVQPPLYFWIAAALAHLFGATPLALRLPSALATIASGGIVAYAVARLKGLRAGLLAALILSTSLMEAIVGRLAIMDALLDLAVAVAILAWFGALRLDDGRLWLLGWLALAFGTLAKGPVALVIVALVIGVWAFWERRAGGRLNPPSLRLWAAGLALFALVLAPWTIAMLNVAGPGAFGQLIGHYTVGRYLDIIENQSGPIWYYGAVVALGFFPWFVYLFPATLGALRTARSQDGGLARLALVWSVLPFVFFSFARTKLPNYIALEFPALAILTALWFDGIVERRDRRSALVWTALVPLTLAGLGLAVWAFSHDNRLTPDLQVLRVGLLRVGICMMLGSLLCFGLLLFRRVAWLAPFALGATSLSLILFIVLYGEPIVERFKPIPRLAAVIQSERRPSDVVAIAGVSGAYALLFYTMPRIETIEDGGGPGDGDPKRVICGSPRAFVVASRRKPSPPSYGRSRRELAHEGGDVLYLFDGPPCTTEASATRD